MKHFALLILRIILIAGCNFKDRSGVSSINDPAQNLYTYNEDSGIALGEF